MSYRDATFLREHIRSIMSFYHPVCIDDELGGYINQLRDNGSIFDRTTKHLVGTCRFVYNYALASLALDEQAYHLAAAHGLQFLQEVHRQPDGGYVWELQGRAVKDGTRHCYGHAFVLLASAGAAKAGVEGAENLVSETYDLLENRFWEPDAQLYVDEIKAGDWNVVGPYRGQNPNMHMCEAYGYLPSHFTEWAKLLLILERYRPEDWMLTRAQSLFEVALDKSWDHKHGGMIYSFAPDDRILDTDRYYWVLAETFAAAASLALRTQDASYWEWYDRAWEYSDRHFVDHEYGAWYRILNANNQKYDDLKSPAAKTDYHPLSACYETLEAMRSAGRLESGAYARHMH